MDAGQSQDAHSSHMSWRQILGLGEDLLCLAQEASTNASSFQESIKAQKDLILARTASLLNSQVSLWLSEDLLRETVGNYQGGKPTGLVDPTPTPPSALMQYSLDHRQVSCAEDSESTSTRTRSNLTETSEPLAVAAPLLTPDREGQMAHVLGVIQVERPDGPAFTQDQMDILEGLTVQASLALQTGLQRQRSEQLAAIYEFSSAINSILDQDRLLDEIVDLIHKQFGYPNIYLFTVHPGRRKIFYKAGSGSRSHILRQEGYSIDLDDPNDLIPWAARHAETVLVNDRSQDPGIGPAHFHPGGAHAELAIPLKFGDTVLGVLDVQSDHPDTFGEEDRLLFEALADIIAIAIRNASLYQSEVWRHRVADSMRQVAGLLSADVALEKVLEAILVELENTLPLDLAAIWLVDEGDKQLSTDGTASLYLAAVRGAGANDLDLEIGLNPQEILTFNLPDNPESKIEESSHWLLQALASEHPVTRSQDSPFEPLGTALDYPGDYSAIAAPLRAGEQPLGVLTLAHHTTGRYGSEARAMTAAFASYAAVAIQNTRLYEAAHEQVWVSTALLQVTEATQSLTDLNELLATVIRITPMLVGVESCLLFIRDELGAFLPAAASGLNSEQQAAFKSSRLTSDEVPALDQLLVNRRPVVLHSDQGNRLITNMLSAGNDGGSSPTGLYVFVPMQSRNQVLGAFLVEYSQDLFTSPSTVLGDLIDERLAIIQGIAQQTAIAVENISLLKSLQEEAYVSVAMLQAAQAIASSNDLDEALNAIVRLIPILVGIERAALFLWDEAHQIFQLTQSYGIPQADLEHLFALGEFPLLDAVLLEGNFVACPLQDDENQSETALEAWSDLAAPEPDQMDEVLRSSDQLVIALPFSIKGQVLGVLTVEEPDPDPSEGLGSNENRRLRQKRLEIITGISQQAALAIQNDQLQSEMFEREQLEREMELARQIQRTFLPEEPPDLPGWGLEVYWRTARQVGGDFYDFYELPGNRLGLVVADVSDKGMAAAMFMTVARTLLRALAQQGDPPTEVLARANSQLTLEGSQGMFVTLAYAILALETGEMQIAIAGHNPPLLLRGQKPQSELLERGGTALGVLENAKIHQVSASLAPGDFLIMYTDGVTESFSPGGELYGVEGLRQAVLDATRSTANEPNPAYPTAQEMLDAIAASVRTFTNDSPLSDDLTLMVLKRKLL